MTIELSQYYDRFDPSRNYDRHLFLAGSVLQSAELNELQSGGFDRLQRVTDVLFKEGDILSGATLIIDKLTGATQISGGALYLRGAVRGVPAASFTIAVIGQVNLGVYVQEDIVSPLEDPALRDPAVSQRNFQEPGASRLRITVLWGYAGDGQAGDFYKIVEVLDGEVVTNQAPPRVDAVAQNIARYDRQSTGGYYISSGFRVTRLDDTGNHQVFSVADGIARVNGQEIVHEHASRLVYAATPDTRAVLLEPHLVTTAQGDDLPITTSQRPINVVNDLAMVRVVTENLTHGAYSGSMDALTLSPVVQVLSVVQGETTFVAGDDYNLTSDKVDWSPDGSEPAPGSTYTVTYQYVDTVTEPANVTLTGLVVPGTIQVAVGGNPAANAELVNGSLVQVSYAWSMPRYDLICVDENGALRTVKGISAQQQPRVPRVPSGLLSLAVIEQRWNTSTRVINNGTRMVPMNELNAVNRRIDTLFALVAEERLAIDVAQKDSTAKKGVFTDPFMDDDLRDQGIAQTAAIYARELTLGVESTVHSQSLDAPVTLNARAIVEPTIEVGPEEIVISQVWRTGSMKVNPYDAFSPLPGVALLLPAVDFWTDFQTNWLSPVTRQFDEEIWTNPETRDYWIGRCLDGTSVQGRNCNMDNWIRMHTTVVSNEVINQAEVEKVGTRYVDLQFLRPIEVQFELAGLGAGESLDTVRFDGQSVAFSEVV